MIEDIWCVVDVKVLSVQYVLELVDPLQSVVHVCGQVAVEEAQHVAVEREADGYPALIALEEDLYRKVFCSRISCSSCISYHINQSYQL